MKIACAEFQGNQFIIDGEIDEKHVLQIYQNECGPGYKSLIIDAVTVNGNGSLSLFIAHSVDDY